jgi:hypothetical protein
MIVNIDFYSITLLCDCLFGAKRGREAVARRNVADPKAEPPMHQAPHFLDARFREC